MSKLFVVVRRAPGVAPGRLWETWAAVIRDLLAQGPGRRVYMVSGGTMSTRRCC